jgi:cytochrome c553
MHKEDRMSKTKLMVVVVLAGIVVLSFASGATAAKNKIKGQDVFKEFCKPCHGADSEAGEYTPMSLIQDQWETFFDEKFEETHKGVTDPNHDNKPVIDVLTEEEFDALAKWTVDHAADSEQPMTCG